mmetsp:Transcript_54163/g.118116  ORF Transcript_54163/g.118116 Transcript_54163/m.118116 type:complete len:207 (-) Transcript_54163:28-648(-)
MEPGRGLLAHPILVHDDITLVRDVDAVQKLADILVLHVADVLDQGASPADRINVVTAEDDLVLHVCAPLHRHVGEGIDNAHDLLAEEVSDLHALILVGDSHVDGEVGVHETHLILEALGDADDRVGDVRVASADRGVGLARREPPLDDDLTLGVVGERDVDGHVLERAHNCAAGALDGDLASLEGERHTLRDLQSQALQDGLHDNS